MRDATEAEVVWQYIRWHAEYRNSTHLPIITDPNLNDDKENDARWRILARNEGHVLRVRYPFDGPPRPYQWSFRPAPQDLFAAVFSSYRTESGLLSINEIATHYFHHGHLAGFGHDNNRIVEENIRRLTGQGQVAHDFEAMILCRPHPLLPSETYRVVEGTKRAVAVRVAQLRGLGVPPIRAYFGDHSL